MRMDGVTRVFTHAGARGWLLLLALASCLVAAEPSTPKGTFSLVYDVRIETDCLADVSINLDGNMGHVTRLRIRLEKGRQFDFEGIGEVQRDGADVVWMVPPGKATLRYNVNLNHRRASGGYDSRCTESWALFRGEDLYPPMAVASPDGVPLSHSEASLRVQVPKGWSLVTPFPENGDDGLIIEQPHRYFDRPTGWIIAGRLGVTRERIKGVSVAIASPRGEGLRRLDILALLRWTLPVLKKILPDLPPRLLIVGAGDPMWRGALSGPGSLYIHADRPLITLDGTSPLLHELIHVVTHAKSGEHGDWIVEGMAEYYSLQLLRRSRTVSKRRYTRSLERLAERGRKVETLRVDRADGATTARAVHVLHLLDTLIIEKTDGSKSLDHVLRALGERREPVTTESFRLLAEQVLGGELDGFFRTHVPE